MTVTFPVDQVVPELLTALSLNPCVVLVAEPGAGKTTRVPLALLHAPWLGTKKIIMLEPRRLAARASAKRMADTLKEEVGGTVGYTVRLEKKLSNLTRIEVVTEGILTRRMQSDPELSDVGLLIFDEFHERSLDGDFGLALALDVQRGLRDDLKILVMSATLDTEKLSAHLNNAPVISAKGRMFPVGTTHLERPDRFALVNDTEKAVLRALREMKGSLLVFLPGEGEIKRLEEQLFRADLAPNIDVRPLYGAMALAQQDEAIRPSSDGRRKIVLATTIAETSLTIDGIEAVIDTGLKRAPRFDAASGMSTLETVRVSQASAEQRKGRAGRLMAGHCYRLWPEAEQRALLAHDDPEIRIADLSSLVLDLAQWGVTLADGLPWLERPPQAAFNQAQDLLRQLGALDENNTITTHGRDMSRLPLHPRLSHMVIAAHAKGAGTQAAEVAALISERDGSARDASIDVEQRLLMLRGGARERWKQTVKQITDNLERSAVSSELGFGVLLAFAYPDRIGRKRGSRFQLSGGGGAVLPEHDNLNKSDWITVATLDGAAGDGKARLAAALTVAEIEMHFGSLITTKSGVHWDQKASAISAAEIRTLGAIILSEKPMKESDPDLRVKAMLEGVAVLGLKALPWTEAADSFRARIVFLRRTMPELELSDLSDDVLSKDYAWLEPYLQGMSRKSDLVRLDLLQILRNLVPHDVLQRFEKLTPQRMEVPSGGHYKIDYDGDGDPVLRVRLQEMFGLHAAPQVADGRVKVKIELLSPAGRPVAVTQSLETFWTNGYPDVRKDLRGRYPKHYWPENPLEAQAVAPRKLR